MNIASMKFPLSRTLKVLFPRAFFRADGWNLSSVRLRDYVIEYADWSKYYLPISVKGLTILDVGAGEGETAKFFLEHGASKVFCIEADKRCYTRLAVNAKTKPIVALNKMFCLADLRLPFDFMKMDIEGCEEELLNARFPQPAAVELHGLPMRRRFVEQGWTIKIPPSEDMGSFGSHAYAWKLGGC